MNHVPEDIVVAAVEIIGTTGVSAEEIEKRVRALVEDDMTARRLVDWIPEAFGLVLASHISSNMKLPNTFSVKARTGQWIELKMTNEPVFPVALLIAQRMYHEGPRERFKNIAVRSALVSTVDNALAAGDTLEDASLSGPSFFGIPAEVYSTPPKSFWQRLFSR